ncbi:MAG TPA: DUF6443 domain-containing protein, partial [Ohtaekwangia sp.]|uniref:DUF6443 domain-containing protein n=1 Tax=Ohtaekwangia sp. TaxID=2066019 RepID=UPI002F948B2F
MKLPFATLAFVMISALQALGQNTVTLFSAPARTCGDASGWLGLGGCTNCTIVRWEDGTMTYDPSNPTPVFTVSHQYPASSDFAYSISAPGRKAFRAIYKTSGGLTEQAAFPIEIVADAKPVAGTLNITPTSLLNGGSVQLTLTGYSGTVTFKESPSGRLFTSNTANITASSTYYATVTNGACDGTSTATMFNSNSVAVDVYKTGTLTGTTSVVEGEKINLSLTGNNGAAVRWEYSTDAGTTWTNFDYASYANGSVTGDKLADTHELWTTTRFRALINLGPFGTAYTNTIDVIYRPYTQAYATTTNGSNYVRAQQVTVSGITDPGAVATLLTGQKKQVTNFQDGFGRSVQQNMQKATPLQMDMVVVTAYDSKGRQAVQYLPYVSASATGDYRSTALTEQAAYYANGTSDKAADSPYPFAKSTFDSSPLGRLREAGNVGQQWQPGGGHTTMMVYSNNDASEIRIINADLTSPGFYDANTLSKTEVTDPDGKKTQTLTDKAGRTIVSRTQLDETVDGVVTPWLETYYVYNTNGSVKYIIPPKGVAALKAAGWAITAALRDQYFHQFVYDKFGRTIEKKVPGQAWMYYCYDRFDRLVLMQDDYTRSQNKWLYIKYDRRNRPVMLGLYNTTYTTRTDLQLNVIDPLYAGNADKYYEDRGTAAQGYTNQCFPTTSTEVLTVNYYDS